MDMPMGPYSVAMISGLPVAGMMQLPDETMPVFWGFYVTVSDVDATIEKAVANGGVLIEPAFDIPGTGRMAVLQDPQGAVFSLIKYEESDEALPPRKWDDNFQTHGAFSWFELRVPDADAVADFYSELFGWTYDRQEMAMGPYTMVNVGETGIGGLLSVDPKEMPPHWGAYVTVDDIDAFAVIVGAQGGKVLFPVQDVPGVGRMTMISDPQGGIIAAMQYQPMES